MKSTKELIATRLKELRKKRGLTQEELAEAINLDAKHLSKLERAGSYPSIPTLEKLADALQVELKDIFNFDSLKDKNYIIDEFQKILKYSDNKHLQVLYKIHRDLIS